MVKLKYSYSTRYNKAIFLYGGPMSRSPFCGVNYKNNIQLSQIQSGCGLVTIQ